MAENSKWLALKWFKKQNNLVNKDIADIIGTSEAFVSQVYNNQCHFSQHHLDKLAEKYDISILFQKDAVERPAICYDKADMLDEIMREYNIPTKKDFADKLGISPQSLNDWYYRKSFDANRIIQKFPDINAKWILTQEGTIRVSGSRQDNFRLVPMYNLDARGGFLSNEVIDSSQYIVDRVPFKGAAMDDICIPVSGNSMMPTIRPGAIVLLRPIQFWREFLEMGQIYVLCLRDGRRIVKELRSSTNKDMYRCISHNPDFDEVELPKSLIESVFLVKDVYEKLSM